MKFFVKTKLSENISETPEGFLLCVKVPLTHTGNLRYVHPEHPFGEEVQEVIMRRKPEELFSPSTMSSFEGKDFTVQHPEEFIDPDNYQELTNGVLFNVRKGKDKINIDDEEVEVLLGDILIKGRKAIDLVKQGVREISLGYECEWELVGDGVGEHSKIVGNHCALVDQGRAGIKCAINDHKIKENEVMDTKLMEKFKKLFGKTIDEAVKDEEEKKAADEESEKAAKEKAAKDEEEKAAKEKESKDGDVEARFEKIEAMLAKLMDKFASEDEDTETELVVADDEESEEDEEKEESEDSDEEDKEKKEKATDTMSRAEILAPGIKKSKNIMKEALEKAYKTKDGKKVIDSLTGGKDVSKLKDEAVHSTFIAASELLKVKRVNDYASTKITTIDAFPDLKGKATSTVDEINKANKEFWENKKK